MFVLMRWYYLGSHYSLPCLSSLSSSYYPVPMIYIISFSTSTSLRKDADDIDLLASRVLRRRTTQRPGQRGIGIPLVGRAHVPPIQRHWVVGWAGRGLLGIVDILRDEELVVLIEADLLAADAWGEHGDRHVRRRVVRKLHGRGLVEVSALKEVSEEADDAHVGIRGDGGRVVEGVGGSTASDDGAEAETFDARTLVAGDQGGAVGRGIRGGYYEGEWRRLVEVLGGGSGSSEGDARQDRGGSHFGFLFCCVFNRLEITVTG